MKIHTEKKVPKMRFERSKHNQFDDPKDPIITHNYWVGYYNNLLIVLDEWEFEKDINGLTTFKSQEWYNKLIHEIKELGNFLKKKDYADEFYN